MSTKRVLILIKGLGRGGAEQLLASAAPYYDLDRFSYEVAYRLPWKDALVPELRDAGIPVHCLEGGRGIGWPARLRRLIRGHDIDLVHSHSPTVAVAARVVAPSDVRCVYTEHNVWERYHRLTYWANMVTFPRSNHVFAVSNHVRDSIRYPRGFGGLRMPPVETLYHGIDREAVAGWTSVDGVRAELGIADGAPVIGTVANFKTHKRLDRLLAAAELVRRRIPDARFVLVGQGPLEDEIRRASHARGLDDTVVFTGFRSDAQRIAASFDIFAMSSEFEGLSIAVIEALALGKPTVVTDVGGLPEVVTDGREGFVVAAADPASLADRIVTLIEDPSLRARMGRAAEERSRAFDIRTAVRRMEEIYEELMS